LNFETLKPETLKHTYFVADFHLGLALYSPREREQKIVRFLDSIKDTAQTIYLLGDVFDFWWEYKTVVPRGFVRFLGKLAELTDAGVRICFFAGNHDIWAKDYLQQECGVEVFHGTRTIAIAGKTFFVGHGDNIGNRALGERILKWIFYNRVLQRLFAMLHPRWGIGFGHLWSKSTRTAKGIATPFRGKDENLYRFSVEESTRNAVDYFVFGHRHTPVQMPLPTGAQLSILSDWIIGSTYAVFDGNSLMFKQFE
jgi:UDP-2,3-diacylglucosamine hydrolase